MGSAHNMFGSVNAVHVLAEDGTCGEAEVRGRVEVVGMETSLAEGDDGRLRFGRFIVDDIVRGQTIEEVLSQANHQVTFPLQHAKHQDALHKGHGTSQHRIRGNPKRGTHYEVHITPSVHHTKCQQVKLS